MSKINSIQLLILMLIATAVSTLSIYRQSIRLDESQSLRVAVKSVPAIAQYIAQDVHVPLYAVLLHFWVKLFGHSIESARTLSLLFFIASIPALFILVKEYSDERISWLTVLMFSLSPFMLWFSAETRMYTLFTFVSVLNHLYFLRFFRHPLHRNKIGYFITTAIGLYTHYFFVFQIVCQGIYIAGLTIARKKQTILPPLAVKLSAWIKPVLSAVLLFVPWLMYVWRFGGVSNTTPNIPPPNLYTVFQVFITFLFGFPAQTLQTVMISIWPVLMIALLVLFTRKGLRPVQSMGYFILVSVAPVILVYGVSLVRPMFLGRYLIFTLPSFLFILAWCLVHIARRNERFLYSAVTLILVSFLLYQNLSSSNPVREDYKSAAYYLTKTVTYRDIIAASAPFTVYPLEFSYQGAARITTIPEWNRYEIGPIPQFNYTDLYTQMTDFEKRYDRLFLILSYDQGYETELVNYLATNYPLMQELKFARSVRIAIYNLQEKRTTPL